MARSKAPLLVLSSGDRDGGDGVESREETKIGVDRQDMLCLRDGQIKAVESSSLCSMRDKGKMGIW